MASPHHLRLVPPSPAPEPDDAVAVLATCLLTGLVPWAGFALLGRWSPSELALGGILVAVGLGEAIRLLPLPRRSRHP